MPFFYGLGVPTPASGFIDIDMRTIVRDSGIGQRRIERAIALFKEAEFVRVTQPRTQNEEGDYFGCRAIRVVTDTLFEWLGLGPMLQRERAKASERLRRNAQKLNRKLSDFMSRMRDTLRKAGRTLFQQPSFPTDANRMEETRRWNMACAKYMIAGCDPDECRRRTNAELGLPADYSPGRRA